MPFLQRGDVDDIVIPAGQSIRIGAFRNAIASVSIPYGLRGGPVTIVQDGALTIGPFPAGAAVSVKAVSGSIEYVIAASPALTDIVYNSALVAITGGTIAGATINAASVGLTTPAVVRTSNLQATYTDSSGTPGNVTNSSPRGRAAFAAAASAVTVTSTLVTAASTILVSYSGGDATLTSVAVVAGAGSFVVTGNAAATGITKFDFVVVN